MKLNRRSERVIRGVASSTQALAASPCRSRQMHVALRERNGNALGIEALLDRFIERPQRLPELLGLHIGPHQENRSKNHRTA